MSTFEMNDITEPTPQPAEGLTRRELGWRFVSGVAGAVLVGGVSQYVHSQELAQVDAENLAAREELALQVHEAAVRAEFRAEALNKALDAERTGALLASPIAATMLNASVTVPYSDFELILDRPILTMPQPRSYTRDPMAFWVLVQDERPKGGIPYLRSFWLGGYGNARISYYDPADTDPEVFISLRPQAGKTSELGIFRVDQMGQAIPGQPPIATMVSKSTPATPRAKDGVKLVV